MANDEWTPDKELPDKEAEEEANRRAQAAARVKWLQDHKYTKPEEKKKKGFFD